MMTETVLSPHPSERKTIFSVTQITLLIKKNLEEGFGQVTIRGEISNFKLHTSGHAYFTLKDDSAQITCVMFKGSLKDLPNLPKDGDEVVCSGELTVYPGRGNYQIIVKELTSSGVGQILLRFQALKEKLQKEGYFAPEHKKKLPKYPKTIGVVTSPTGSVIQDILRVLQRRFPKFHLLLFPVKVQGEGASQEIAKAISCMNTYHLCDVMIVGRGGGSLEDLWAFNEEIVAKAIYNSTIPIISAVGHETDVTISDFVADVRAPTPSAAAEIAIGPIAEQLEFLERTKRELSVSMRRSLQEMKQKNSWYKNAGAFSSISALLAMPIQRLDAISGEIDQTILYSLQLRKEKLFSMEKTYAASSPFAVLHQQKKKVEQFKLLLEGALQRIASLEMTRKKLLQLEEEIKRGVKRVIENGQQKIFQMKSLLFSLHPDQLLRQGYCILFRENSSSIILSTSQVSPLDRIVARLKDGTITAIVDYIADKVVDQVVDKVLDKGQNS